MKTPALMTHPPRHFPPERQRHLATTTPTDAVPTRVLEASPSSTPAYGQWQLVARAKRRIPSPHSYESAPEQETQTLASTTFQIELARNRAASMLSSLLCPMTTRPLHLRRPLCIADSSATSTTNCRLRLQRQRRTRPPRPYRLSSPHWDEASSLPQPCSHVSTVAAPPAADCVHDMSPQTCAVTASARCQKKRKTVQVTTPVSAAPLDRLRSKRQSSPPCVKRKPDSQSVPPAVRRSTRQRTASKVFDPSDSTANAGYVQARAISPDMQSGLPFDQGELPCYARVVSVCLDGVCVVCAQGASPQRSQ